MSEILRYARSLIEANPGMKFYAEGKTWVNFTLTEWDAGLRFREPSGGEAILPLLSFGSPLRLSNLTIGLWASSAIKANRESLFRIAKEYPLAGVVGGPNSNLTGQYCEITRCDLLRTSSTVRLPEEVEAIILPKWNDFLKRELPRIIEAIRQERWLWELP